MAATVGSGNSVELDPVFLKALVLLHSKNPDSLDQLRALRDEAIRQHDQPVPSSSKERSKDGKSGSLPDRRSVITAVTASETRTSSQVKEPKAELTTVETIEVCPVTVRIENVADVHTDGASIETMEELSSGLVETVEELSSSLFMEAPASKKAKLEIHVDKVLDEEDLKSHDTMPVEDLTIDLGTVCAVCFRQENNLSGNKFVECQECHSHYHQRCHEPRVSDQDVNDPRLVWYCTPCTKKMKEIATSPVPKARLPSESFAPARLGMHRPPQLQPFKRQLSSDSKSFASPTTSQSFVIPALSNSSGAAPSKAGANPGSQNIAMQSGMKRLQMMKKKAAQKILNQQQIRIPRR